MPRGERTHAFRASQAVSWSCFNIQASSKRGKGKEKGRARQGEKRRQGKGKAKAKGKATEVDLESMTMAAQHDKPTTSFLPPGPPFAVPSSSPLPLFSCLALSVILCLDGAGSFLVYFHTTAPAKKSKHVVPLG